MAPSTPQVLSRRANGASSTAHGQGGGATAKGRGNNDDSRPRRGRGQGDKNPEASKKGENDKPRQAKQRAQQDGCKLVVRRLPPGMTREEFATILGQTWEVGKGKVDWCTFAQGKIPTDAAKTSRPGRAYIHLSKKEDAGALDEAIRIATWEDAKGSFTSPSLVGPPMLEYSIYKKVPNNKRRTDTRQGTIDQDPEFMAFLEELANPPPIGVNGTGDDTDEGRDKKITTTPLVEYLKEKKANKGKDSGSGKKRGEGRGEKGGKGGSKEDDGGKKKGKDAKTDKSDKSRKETIKVLTKKAGAESNTEGGSKAAKETGSSNAAAAQDVPKSRRAGIAAAARILQRDLGLSPGSAHRRARQDAAKAETSGKPGDKENIPAVDKDPQDGVEATEGNKSQQQTNTGKSSGRKRGGKNEKAKAATEAATPAPTPTAILKPPVILKKRPETESTTTIVENKRASTPTSQQAVVAATTAASKPANNQNNAKGAGGGKGASTKKPPAVTAGGKRAFVKHVNTSQGITEPVLRQGLEVFGTITAIEIDKRKSFAYVDFADHDSLVKAISASPVSVAQGSVQVVERKDKKPAAPPNAGGASGEKDKDKEANKEANKEKEKGSGRGRRGRGGGGGSGGGGGGGGGSGGKGNNNATNTQAGSTASVAATPAPSGESG